MEGYGASTYGDRIAAAYDGRPEVRSRPPEAAVDRLAELAAGGAVLELAIGTGRIALPLAARGVAVHGIDASAAMVARLRAKPGGASIPVTMGDFAEAGIEVDGGFALVFVAFNTFFALTTQERQVHCFERVAACLMPGGRFVLEAFVPDLARYVGGQHTATTRVGLDEVQIDASILDPVTQVVSAQHIVVGEHGTQLYPVVLRYAWPAELDLMARLAGLALERRDGGWGGEPFSATSPSHVSVYRKQP